MNLLSLWKTMVPAGWRRGLRERALPLMVKHLAGRSSIRLAENQAAVTCVYKNGEYYLQQFIEHYLKMGFQHIFFLDNGSSDEIIETARKYENVSVYRCEQPIERYMLSFKKHLAERTVVGGWCLDADMDEFFDYPFSDQVGLHGLLDYLNGKGYTAVMNQMLDMFSDRPLSHLTRMQQENLKEVYRYYDISQVSKVAYRKSEQAVTYGGRNVLPNEDISLCYGGVRKTLYGLNPLLTKHSLFRTGHGLELFPHGHFVNRAKLADMSCLLIHYKLVSNASETSRDNRDAFHGVSKGYGDLLDLLAKKPGYRIKRETAEAFQRAEELLETGFLFASDDYRAFVRRCVSENLPKGKAI